MAVCLANACVSHKMIWAKRWCCFQVSLDPLASVCQNSRCWSCWRWAQPRKCWRWAQQRAVRRRPRCVLPAAAVPKTRPPTCPVLPHDELLAPARRRTRRRQAGHPTLHPSNPLENNVMKKLPPALAGVCEFGAKMARKKMPGWYLGPRGSHTRTHVRPQDVQDMPNPANEDQHYTHCANRRWARRRCDTTVPEVTT